MSKPSRPCVFCGAATGLTKEHIWSQWLRKHTTASGPTLTTTEFDYNHGPNATAIIHPTNSKTEHKTPLNLQAREVCRDCNGGWMSRLDEQVKPDILALMQGRGLVLTPDRAAAVATWATMKSFADEFIGRPGPDSTPVIVSTPAMRRHILDHAEPPPNTLV